MARSSEVYSRSSSRQRRRGRRRKSILPQILGVLIVCLILFLGYLLVTSLLTNRFAEIKISVGSAEIVQDEPIPLLSAEVSCSKKDKWLIEKDPDYSVGELLSELKNPGMMQVAFESDGTTEGEFPITVIIDPELLDRIEVDYSKKVKLVHDDGVLTVINKYGAWEDDKFKRYDGSYVVSDFIESRGGRYYFDDSGTKYVGFLSIEGQNYCFDPDGRMYIGWFEDNGNRYYADDDGNLHKGWLTIEEDRYYMNEETGIATTGFLQIGITECEFDETGLLTSEVFLIDPNKPTIALTFDDGPGGRTSELIACLKKYNAHATFYMLGQCIPRYPETIKEMIDAGCELGNHTYDHPYLTNLSVENMIKEMDTTDKEMIDAGGHAAPTMRPPGGYFNETVAENIGKPVIFWSIDTRDWEHRDTQMTINSVLSNVSDGDIILMHDIHSPTIDAALQLIPMLIDRGYQLVTVSELAQVKEIQLENGVRYSSLGK